MNNPTATPSELEFVIEDNGGELIMFASLTNDPDYDQHLDVVEFDHLCWRLSGELMWSKELDDDVLIDDEIKHQRRLIEALGAIWNPAVSHF